MWNGRYIYIQLSNITLLYVSRYMVSHFGSYKVSYTKYFIRNLHCSQNLIYANKTLVMDVVIFCAGDICIV